MFLLPLRLFADELFEGSGFVAGLLVGIEGGELLADGTQEGQRSGVGAHQDLAPLADVQG